MSTDSSLEIPASLGQPVPVNQVGRALNELWSANDTATKASLINFVLYSVRPDSLKTNTDIISAIAREHACHAIVIAQPSLEQAESEATKAWITAHCHIAGNKGKSMCSEQISLLIGAKTTFALPNLVFAHLDSDLPVVFWWQGGFTSHFTELLYDRIDRLVIDSTSWTDAGAELAVLERAHRRSGRRFVVLDLTWSRLLPYRLALAACFDHPAAIKALPSIDRLEIHYRSGHQTTAALFAAWAADRAGWTLSESSHSPSGFEFNARGSDHPIQGSLVESKDSGAPLALARLSGKKETEFSITQEDDFCLRSTVQLPNLESTHTVPAPSGEINDLVLERLSRGTNTRIYFSHWQTALAILRQ